MNDATGVFDQCSPLAQALQSGVENLAPDIKRQEGAPRSGRFSEPSLQFRDAGLFGTVQHCSPTSAGSSVYLGRNGYWGPGLLAALEAELIALRRCTPALGAAFAVAFRHAVGGEAGRLADLRRAGDRIVEAVELESRRGELAYHDRHHVAEAVLAMGWLCGVARALGTVASEEAALGVIAMIGHDLLHDGSPPRDGLLEARSASAVADIIPDLDSWQRSVVRAVIIGTNPSLVAENAARAARLVPDGPLGRSVDLVVAMANEADVFASFLPNLGPYLTQRLVDERCNAGHDASGLNGPGDRQAFLAMYRRFTPAARRLGMAELSDGQSAAAGQLALRKGCWTSLPQTHCFDSVPVRSRL